ncbi:hypothetical protein SUGI_0100300 [Cryptomeria japonica]|nr:hypothetical protein SUGI_0100300 [Cryptomeria japonica]
MVFTTVVHYATVVASARLFWRALGLLPSSATFCGVDGGPGIVLFLPFGLCLLVLAPWRCIVGPFGLLVRCLLALPALGTLCPRRPSWPVLLLPRGDASCCGWASALVWTPPPAGCYRLLWAVAASTGFPLGSPSSVLVQVPRRIGSEFGSAPQLPRAVFSGGSRFLW